MRASCAKHSAVRLQRSGKLRETLRRKAAGAARAPAAVVACMVDALLPSASEIEGLRDEILAVSLMREAEDMRDEMALAAQEKEREELVSRAAALAAQEREREELVSRAERLDSQAAQMAKAIQEKESELQHLKEEVSPASG
ncbi:hypothetical protein T484DRAFT_1787050 [Baffinella frigidus]|nr:hypothetical protein T484DRAFT_1787050 [Cryptophyta sp. CCMP2293]